MSFFTCKELIELYHKVGGTLTVDYRNNTIKVKNSNLKCEFNEKEYFDVEHLGVTYAFSPYDLKHLTDKNLCDNSIKQKNRYLKENEYGFTIKYLNT